MILLTTVQIVICVFLIGSILLQAQASGISQSFGGGGEFYRSRRSAEKFLIGVTIILAIFFAIVSILLLISH